MNYNLSAEPNVEARPLIRLLLAQNGIFSTQIPLNGCISSSTFLKKWVNLYIQEQIMVPTYHQTDPSLGMYM